MIHETAKIHPEAKIDSGVDVGPYCIIGPKVSIRKGTKLISHVVVDGRTEIGEDNLLFPFSALGGVPQDLKYNGEDTKLVIGSRNKIRECSTLSLGTVQGGGVTTVGNDCLLMAYTHLGHDCRIGNGCILSNSCNLAGHVILDDFVTIAGMVGVAQKVRIGSYAYIAGSSGTDRDVPPYVIAMGERPCVIKGTNIVGLKRRGFNTPLIQNINEAIQLWMRQDVQKEQCLLDIESQYGESKEIQLFVDFLRESRGVIK